MPPNPPSLAWRFAPAQIFSKSQLFPIPCLIIWTTLALLYIKFTSKIAPDCTILLPWLKNFPGGACPRTPLEWLGALRLRSSALRACAMAISPSKFSLESLGFFSWISGMNPVETSEILWGSDGPRALHHILRKQKENHGKVFKPVPSERTWLGEYLYFLLCSNLKISKRLVKTTTKKHHLTHLLSSPLYFKAKKKNSLFPVTRPTLVLTADPRLFF